MRQQLLNVLLSDEADRLRLWLNPLGDARRGAPATGDMPSAEVRVTPCPRLVTC